MNSNINSNSQRMTPSSLSCLPYRVQLLSKANPRLPVTAEGLPIGFYRVDLLPQEPPGDAQEEVQALRNSYVDLIFDNGYPTFSDGRPFWYKLEYEPGFAYGVFQIYLEAIDSGPREITLLSQNEEIRNIATRILQAGNGIEGEGEGIGGIDNRPSVPIEAVTSMLQEFSILYLWRARAKAHDLYTEAASRHLKIRRQTSSENEHFLLAADLLKKLKIKMLGSPNFFDDMAPKTAVDLLGKLVAIQRISTGLPAGGPLPSKEASDDTTFEMIMRSVGERVSKGNIYDQSGRQAATGDALSKVLEDPHAAGMMQEVIIRVTKASQNHEEQQGNRFTGRGRGRTIEPLSSDDLTAPYNLDGAPGANLDNEEDKEDKDKGNSSGAGG